MKNRDLNIFFTKNTDTGDITLATGNAAIIQSIKNIILTRLGERPFNYYFGTGILDLLFDQPSSASLSFLQSDVAEKLRTLEPRITIRDVEIEYPVLNEINTDARVNIRFILNNSQTNAQEQTVSIAVNL
jgi:phage baseplate assembly protein W